MRLIPRSLHRRMIALSAAATLVVLLIGGWAIAGVLERFVIGGLDQRLDSEIALLASTIDKNGRTDRRLLEQRLEAFDAGPGWRWQIVGPDVTIGSTDFPALDRRPPAPPAPDGGPELDRRELDQMRLHPLDGASEDGVRIHARTLTLRTDRGPVILTTAAPRDVVRRPIQAALAPLLAALAIVAALSGIATLVQLRLGLRPIRRLRDQVAAIRRGECQAVDEDQITELLPLAIELNALARDNARTLAAARQSAANLAHTLKTPIATLALGVRGQADNEAQVERINWVIRHHLGRARAQLVDHRSSTPIAPVVADLIETVRLIHGKRRIVIDSRIEPDLAVAVDLHDAQELIGNLLDNAAKFSRFKVHVEAASDPADRRRAVITISDDGKGIPESERSKILRPGVRLDEQGDGHGFGLSIVNELAESYGGSLELDVSPSGGLAASVSLPTAYSGADR